MGFSHSPITLTVSKRRPPSTLGGSENNITSVSVKILYFDFDETLFHSRAISVSVEATNIPNHSDYHNIEEIEWEEIHVRSWCSQVLTSEDCHWSQHLVVRVW